MSDYNSRVMAATWYVVVNDMVGGYAVTTIDEPLSSARYYGDGRDGLVVAVTVTREVAECIAMRCNP